MPNEKGDYKGAYKVRRGGAAGKQTISVPSTVTGEYLLYINPKTGVMTYEPAGVRK